MAEISDKDKKVKVSIYGEEYSIRGNSDPDYILRVADLVDKKMRAIALNSKNKSPNRIAVLAAMNLAGELLDIKDRLDSDLGKVEDKAKDFLELLDSKLTDAEKA